MQHDPTSNSLQPQKVSFEIKSVSVTDDDPKIQELLDLIINSWIKNNPVSVEEILKSNPGLSDESAVRLIYEEYYLQKDAGIDVKSKEVLAKYPDYQSQLQALFHFEHLLDDSELSHALPEPGDCIGPFKLIHKIGRGAVGQTYIAQEQTLADRLVVLKITKDDQEEHLALARLQHTHIMPLYSEHVIEELGLRILCMPYLGGSGLDLVLKRIHAKEAHGRRGRDILSAIDQMQPQGLARHKSHGHSRVFFQSATYPDAIAYIGMCLARASSEAHARDLVHMDIKPSNVLISTDGVPLLLDFHLARKPVISGEMKVDRIGGTEGWMSPEQHLCFNALRQSKPMPCAIDGRSDIYAIGLLMLNAIIPGAGPHELKSKFAHYISVGFHDIIEKCLENDPDRRYQTAEALADDLRRHLENLPLKGVRNRSLHESITKWRIRNPSHLFLILATISAVVVISLALHFKNQQKQTFIDASILALMDAQKLQNAGEYDLAFERLTQLAQQIKSVPELSQENIDVQNAIMNVRREKLTSHLHEIADEIRFRFGSLSNKSNTEDGLLKKCQSIWDKRNELVKFVDSEKTQIKSERMSEVTRDLLEIAMIMAHLTLETNEIDAKERATRLLDDAQELAGNQFVIQLARTSLNRIPTDQIQNNSTLSSLKPAKAWEFNQLGRFYLNLQKYNQALPYLKQAVLAGNNQFWFQYDLAACYYFLGQFEPALAAWSATLALRPSSTACRINRALVWESLNLPDEAISDYQIALQLDPTLGLASLQLGMLHFKKNQPATALKYYSQAIKQASDRESQAKAWFQSALIHDQSNNRESARHAAREAAKLGNTDAVKWLSEHHSP